MESTDRTQQWAADALRTFWRRTFTQLAVRHEQAAQDRLKAAQACRERLKAAK